MEKKSLPLGIKILAIIFLLHTIWFTPVLIVKFSTLKMTELTPYECGRIAGAFSPYIFRVAINLFACIGLLRLKNWGIVCASLSLINIGIAFGGGLGLGFVKGFGSDSEAAQTVAILIGWAISAIIIIKLIKYMRKSLKQLQAQ